LANHAQEERLLLGILFCMPHVDSCKWHIWTKQLTGQSWKGLWKLMFMPSWWHWWDMWIQKIE
jgi:hypothetical protein